MKQWTKAFRNLFKKGRNNLIKILSLAVGLAIGLVLFTKVYFENHYDEFFPDADRIYGIMSKYDIPGLGIDGDYRTPGGVAPGLKEALPEIEVATRLTPFSWKGTFYTQQKKALNGNFALADPNLFEVLPRPMIVGNAKETLARPMYALVSRKLAEKIGNINEVVGQTIELDTYRGKMLTIGGVFEDLPENSHLKGYYDVIVSISSSQDFIEGSSEGWYGGDRYLSYIKLRAGVDMKTLKPLIKEVVDKHLPLEELRKNNIEIDYVPLALTKIHSDSPFNKQINLLIAILAFAVLFTAIVNYILIVISSLVNRTREVAIYKCYGASFKNIRSTMLIESAVDLIAALMVAGLLIILFRHTIQDVLDNSIFVLFSGKNLVIILVVCAFSYLLTGYIPARLFAKIPISAAFKIFKSSRKGWKLAMLFIQIVATAFLMAVLLVGMIRQYRMMMNHDPGYTYRNRASCDLNGVSAADFDRAYEAVKRLPEVESVASSYTLPFISLHGSNVFQTVNGERKALFNVVDLESIDANYLSFFEIPIISGEDFIEGKTGNNEIVISESFAKKLIEFTGWKEGVIAKSIEINRGTYTIRGVYPDFWVGSIQSLDNRPSVMYYADRVPQQLLIKLKNYSGESLYKVTQTLEQALPDKYISVIPLEDQIKSLYADSTKYQQVISIGAIISLIISLIGLIGYVGDDVNRRSTELAIRKVNGAKTRDILLLFMKDITLVTLPAIIIGSIGAHFVNQLLLSFYVIQVPLPFYLYLLCGLLIYSIVLGVTSLRCLKAANENPIKYLTSL